MFIFYWLFQHEGKWLAVFKQENTFIYAEDKESLEKALSSAQILVSYGNYQGSDKFLAKILSDGKSEYLQQYLSIDLSQEIKNRTIEEIGYYLNLDVKAKTPKEFCEKRIAICEKIFEEREEYLETKFEIVEEFKLPARAITYTRARLAAELLKAKKMPKRPNILFFKYDKYLPKNELPQQLVDFYHDMSEKYKCDQEEKHKNDKLKMTIANLTHTFGVGGVHAAKEKYHEKGLFLLIDINQFFPTIIKNNDLLAVGVQDKQMFEHLYQKKVETNKLTYKILINAINGAMNTQFSNLYDPQKYYSVTVNGQLIITHLIKLLEGFYEDLIQTNTDGIVIKIKREMEQIIHEILDLWCEHFHQKVKVKVIEEIWQKDVNNYIFKTKDGSYVRKGIFAKQNYLSANTPVVYEGLFECLVHGVKPQNYVVDVFKSGNLSKFQYVGKLQGDFECIEHQVGDTYRKLNNTINGVATTNKVFGGVYQVKNDMHSKLPGSPERFMRMDQAKKSDVDVNWYVQQIEKNMF
ncbi:DNA polymerase [Enterococcus cecorum]|nr:DNA polymerase [Enterococcus cecorum]